MSEAVYVTRRLIPHETVDRLQGMIQNGQFGPDERLPSQRELSEKLGISRPSLREAISVLETIGLVRVEVGRGVFVNPPAKRTPRWRNLGQASPRDVYELRYSVEGYAAGLAATRISQELLGELRNCYDAMKKAADSQDVVSMATEDSRFHSIIMKACGNNVLTDSYFASHRMIVETQRAPMGRLELLQLTASEHLRIVCALEQADPTASALAMMAHIAATADRAGVKILELPVADGTSKDAS